MLPKVVHYNINLPYEGPTKKIKAAFISDIHIGDIIDYKQVKLLVELVQKEQPDYVFVGGDQLDYYFSYVANDLDNYTSLMRSLHNDQSKIFYVLGNHEYYKDLKEKIEWFHNIGTLICDSVVQLDHNLFLIGRDDAFNSNRAELSTLVRDIPSTATTILLSHQPRDPKEELDNGINLALHGHTHEGQFIPFSWLMYLVYDNPHGYKRVGETHYITSSGFGVSTTSLRVGTHSEIAIIDITLESKENN